MLALCVHMSCPAQWTFLNAFSSEDIQWHGQSELSLDALTSSLFTYDVEMRRLSYDMPFLGEDIPFQARHFCRVPLEWSCLSWSITTAPRFNANRLPPSRLI